MKILSHIKWHAYKASNNAVVLHVLLYIQQLTCFLAANKSFPKPTPHVFT